MTKKISVITGGAGGMGFAAARLLGATDHVVICDVNAQRLEAAAVELRQMGIVCDTVVCDITDRDSVLSLVKQATALGEVRAVIHAAGLSPQMANAELIMRVNALGTIYLNEAFLAVANAGFCMVNVASMAAHLMPQFIAPKRAYRHALTDAAAFFKKVMFVCGLCPERLRPGMAYSISKNFVVWYTKAMAGKFGAKGARVVSVSPGTIDTEMGRLEEKSGSAELIQFAALKRYGRADEVAEVMVFLASDKASFVTGIDIPCDGGVIACITPKQLRSVVH